MADTELNDTREGVVYSATGDFYLAEALRSARSSRLDNPIPHVVFSTVGAPSEEGVSIVRFEPTPRWRCASTRPSVFAVGRRLRRYRCLRKCSAG